MKTLIEMAREAGFSTAHTLGWPECYVRFAELARADAIADEREACAKVCENGVDKEHPTVKGHIMKDFGQSTLLAAAIRARGEASIRGNT